MIRRVRVTIVLFFCSFCFIGTTSVVHYRIFLIGDSTMADKPLIDNPEHGWGQMFPLYVNGSVTVFNHAKNGRSTRSFLYEGRWDAVMQQLRTGDYVFIQFGHNDSKKEDTSRFADAKTDYRTNLMRFVSDARSKGAVPVLFTPVNRRKYDKQGVFVDQHADYPGVVRDIAAAMSVPLVDMHKESLGLFRTLGEERSKPYFLMSVPANRYRALPNGKEDNTHFTRFGAVQIAAIAARGVKQLGLPLSSEIIATEPPALPGDGVVVGLDEYYNNEWRTEKDSVPVRYHYVWTDTTNSGFSELARTIDRLGGDPDTLQSAPTDSSLARFSIYIIVDPDTPKETAAPNYLQPKEIDAIERWVKQGGTLVLMGNDKGNAEFEHFNQLAGRFGIRFNEDMFQDVVNNRYDSGKVTRFPPHRFFDGVGYLFVKQFCSIAVSGPAREVLGTRGAAVIAEASIGKGTVVAVGDPWLYNEYYDNRRVPEGYENASAGRQFMRALLGPARKVR